MITETTLAHDLATRITAHARDLDAARVEEIEQMRADLAFARVAMFDALACLDSNNPGGARGCLVVGLEYAGATIVLALGPERDEDA